MILANAYIFSGMNPCTTLANQYLSGKHSLATVALDSETLGLRVSTVA